MKMWIIPVCLSVCLSVCRSTVRTWCTCCALWTRPICTPVAALPSALMKSTSWVNTGSEVNTDDHLGLVSDVRHVLLMMDKLIKMRTELKETSSAAGMKRCHRTLNVCFLSCSLHMYVSWLSCQRRLLKLWSDLLTFLWCFRWKPDVFWS